MRTPELRFFLPLDDVVDEENVGTNLIGTYDGISAPSLPATLHFKCAFGIFGIPIGEYSVRIVVIQDDDEMGEWEFEKVRVPEPDMVIKFILETEELPVSHEGLLNFDVYLGTERIGRRSMLVRVEEQANE